MSDQATTDEPNDPASESHESSAEGAPSRVEGASDGGPFGEVETARDVGGAAVAPADPREGRIVWLEVDASGADLESAEIRAIAACVTTADLDVVYQGVALDVADHAATADTLVAQLSPHVIEGAAPVAGADIHRAKMLVSRLMPALDGLLHYRKVDVGTVAELARRWNPRAYAERPVGAGEGPAERITAAIDELRYYRSSLLRTGAPPA